MDRQTQRLMNTRWWPQNSFTYSTLQILRSILGAHHTVVKTTCLSICLFIVFVFVCLCIDVSAQWGDGGCQRDLYRSYKVSYHLSSLLWYMYLLIIILRQAQDEINELKCELSMRHSEIAVLEERCPSFLAHTTLHVPGHSLTYPATHSLVWTCPAIISLIMESLCLPLLCSITPLSLNLVS